MRKPKTTDPDLEAGLAELEEIEAAEAAKRSRLTIDDRRALLELETRAALADLARRPELTREDLAECSRIDQEAAEQSAHDSEYRRHRSTPEYLLGKAELDLLDGKKPPARLLALALAPSRPTEQPPALTKAMPLERHQAPASAELEAPAASIPAEGTPAEPPPAIEQTEAPPVVDGAPYPNLLALCFNRPLSIIPAKLDVIVAVLSSRAPGGMVEKAQPRPKPITVNRTAVVPIHGTLVNRTLGLCPVSGLVSYQDIRADIEQALADKSVDRIVLDIDSPGGEASGADELADFIHDVRQQKKIVAIADHLAASAAYQLAASTSRVYVTQGAMLGSIGVIMKHCDQSAYDKARGMKITQIHAGARKADGSPHRPLDDDSRKNLQDIVDSYYQLFVGKVARGRGMSEAAVRATEARIYVGVKAVDVGLADGVSTLAELVAGR